MAHGLALMNLLINVSYLLIDKDYRSDRELKHGYGFPTACILFYGHIDRYMNAITLQRRCVAYTDFLNNVQVNVGFTVAVSKYPALFVKYIYLIIT